jgi:hypothetical protein
MKAIFINADEGRLQEIEIDKNDSLSYLQKCVGGYIEFAHSIPAGEDKTNDVVVDEEGLFKSRAYGFKVAGAYQEFYVGNGVIVGSDRKTGKTISTTMSLEEAKKLITFIEVFNAA